MDKRCGTCENQSIFHLQDCCIRGVSVNHKRPPNDFPGCGHYKPRMEAKVEQCETCGAWRREGKSKICCDLGISVNGQFPLSDHGCVEYYPHTSESKEFEAVICHSGTMRDSLPIIVIPYDAPCGQRVRVRLELLGDK